MTTEDKANKAIAKAILTIHYDLNEEDINSIKERLEANIKWLVNRGGLAGEEAKDAIVDSWRCELEVVEVS